jgi:hypothetical protein
VIINIICMSTGCICWKLDIYNWIWKIIALRHKMLNVYRCD